jgi:methyl-accepting chemotaxis protein
MSKKVWTIGKRISFGFAAVLVIMIALGALIWTRLQTVQGCATDVASRSIPSLELLADAKGTANELRALTFKHIGSPNPADMDKLEANIAGDADQVTKDLDDFEKLASPEAKALAEQAKAKRESYRAVRAEILVLSRAATNAEMSAQVYQKARAELDPATAACIETMSQCQAQVRKEAESSGAAVVAAVHSGNWVLYLGVTASLVLALGLGVVITRSTSAVLHRLTGALDDGANQVATAANQVSSSSQSLARGSGEQAASIEETSSSLEEIASMSRNNADLTGKCKEWMGEVRTVVANVDRLLTETGVSIQEINRSSEATGKVTAVTAATPAKAAAPRTVNGNGRHPVAGKAEKPAPAGRRNKIPLGDDFKDF